MVANQALMRVRKAIGEDSSDDEATPHCTLRGVDIPVVDSR